MGQVCSIRSLPLSVGQSPGRRNERCWERCSTMRRESPFSGAWSPEAWEIQMPWLYTGCWSFFPLDLGTWHQCSVMPITDFEVSPLDNLSVCHGHYTAVHTHVTPKHSEWAYLCAWTVLHPRFCDSTESWVLSWTSLLLRRSTLITIPNDKCTIKSNQQIGERKGPFSTIVSLW